MKFALIGCGRISPNHIVAARNNGLDIVAICDVNEECMQQKDNMFKLGNDVCKYTDYKKMLEIERPDIVAICTESGKHASIALDVIASKCHCVIEKPIALSLEDADKIIDAAESNNVKVCACHQNRFNSAVQKIREAVEMGRFGKMIYGTAQIRWARDYEYYARAKWRGTWKQDGGALMNQCIHDIDLLRWMLGGEIDEVVGMTDRMTHDYIEAEDLGLALIRFKNGAYGIIEGTTDIYPKNLEETLCLFGEKGTVKAGGDAVNIIEEWRFSDYIDDPEIVKKEHHEMPPNVYGYGHTKLYKDMVMAIEEDRTPYVTAKDGRDALELVLGIYMSSLNGQKVKFPLEKGSTTDFKKVF